MHLVCTQFSFMRNTEWKKLTCLVIKKKPWGTFNCTTKMKGLENLRSGKFTARSKSQGHYRFIYIPTTDSSVIQ